MDGRPRYLGLDAGGTKTSWCCIDAAASILATGRAPGAQPAVDGVAAAGRVLADLLVGLVDDHRPASVVIGIAGGGSAAVREGLAVTLREAGVEVDVRFCGDPEIAAAAGLSEGSGLAVWSGTGSFAIARTDDGRLLRGGGRGYLLGDRGSGFAIVRAAAVAAVEAVDGIGPSTELGERLCAAFDVSRVVDLGATLQQLASRDLAARAALVFEAERSGDRVAQRVLDDEAAQLAELALRTAERAGVPAVPCVIGGGVFSSFPTFVARFSTCLHGDVMPPKHAAEFGAACLARAVHRGEAPMSGWLP